MGVTNLTVCAQSLSHVQLFTTPWTVAHQVPLSMRFLRQEYWSRLPFPPPGAFPDPRIEPSNLHLVTLLNSFISSRSVVLFCSEIP